MKLVKVNKNKADHINMYIIPCVATTYAHSLNNRVLKVLLSQAGEKNFNTYVHVDRGFLSKANHRLRHGYHFRTISELL